MGSTGAIVNKSVLIVAIDFPGGKRRRNIKMKPQLMTFIWMAIMTEIKHEVFKTTLLALHIKVMCWALSFDCFFTKLYKHIRLIGAV